MRKQTEVLGGYNPSGYRSERLFATAPDGSTTALPPHLLRLLRHMAPTERLDCGEDSPASQSGEWTSSYARSRSQNSSVSP